MRKALYISLIVISFLLLPVLVFITIKEQELKYFVKTWLYVIAGYVSILCFYIAVFKLKDDKKD